MEFPKVSVEPSPLRHEMHNYKIIHAMLQETDYSTHHKLRLHSMSVSTELVWLTRPDGWSKPRIFREPSLYKAQGCH
jgi:hypothetical protein